MRILIVTPIFPPDIGGPASYVPQLAQRLIKANHQPQVICFCHKKPQKFPFKVMRVDPNQFVIFRQLKLAGMILSQIWKTDLVYIQGTLTVGLVSLVIAKLFGKKTMLKFVGDEVWENSGSSLTMENFYLKNPKTFKLKIHRWVLKGVDTIITPSIYLKNFLISHHQLNNSKIQVIPNPVVIPKDLAIIKPRPGFVFVGRLVAWKNVSLIIKAIVLAHIKNPAIKLSIIGDGDQKLHLKKLIDTYNASVYIELLGSFDKPKTLAYIKSADGLILMSNYEGQSHVLLEALILGTPVIASDISPNRELLSSEDDLVSFDLGDLSQKIIETKKQKKSVNSNQFKQRHSWENHLDQLTKLF